MDRPHTEVVVVAYGPVSFLVDCLDVLGGTFRVHIIDNGQSDQVRAEAGIRGFDYVRPDGNLGFAAAVNLALRRCDTTSDVLLLNPDARIPPAGVDSLARALRSKATTAAVAPRLVRPDGVVERTLWPIPTPLLPWRGILGSPGVSRSRSAFLSGAVLLLRSESLRDVGEFDERFFLYSEETDWQHRAVRRGWVVREVPEVTAMHLGGATSADPMLRDRLFHGSAEIFVRKWFGARGWWVFRLGSLLAAARRTTTGSATQRSSARRAVVLYLKGPASQLPQFARRGA